MLSPMTHAMRDSCRLCSASIFLRSTALCTARRAWGTGGRDPAAGDSTA
jgi:hypothetical protein